MSETTVQVVKVRKIADQTDVFEVLIDGEVVGTVTKRQQNAAAKQGRSRTGYKMKTVWAFAITSESVPLGRRFGTVITTKKDAVDLIVERVIASR